MIAFDKFEGYYIKILPDFNLESPVFYFSHCYIQQIDANYTLFLAKVTDSNPKPEFRYKPEQERLPDFCAILLKRQSYSFNTKDGDKWKQVVIKPSPVDIYLLDLIDNNEEFFAQQLSGFLNCNCEMLEAIPPQNKSLKDPNASGLFKFFPSPDKEDFPIAELKASSANSNSKGNYQKKETAAKTPIDMTNGYYLIQDALDLAKGITSQIEKANSFNNGNMSENEKLAITIALIMDKLNNR